MFNWFLKKNFNTSTVEQWSENYIKMVELEIDCMETSYFIRGDNAGIFTLP